MHTTAHNSTSLYTFNFVPFYMLMLMFSTKLRIDIFVRTFVSFNKHRTTCNQIKFNISLLNISFGATAEGVLWYTYYIYICTYVCLFLLLNTTRKAGSIQHYAFYIHIHIFYFYFQSNHI